MNIIIIIKRESCLHRETVFSRYFCALLLFNLKIRKKKLIFFRLRLFPDLLGDVLANVFGNVLALRPRHLPLNVPAVLHLPSCHRVSQLLFCQNLDSFSKESHLVLSRDLLALC